MHIFIGCGWIAAAGVCAETESPTRGTVPAVLHDVAGQRVNVDSLARRHRLVFVTLKATWCPVCSRQLLRLRQLLPRLEKCGAYFVILSPGPAEEIARVKAAVDFPFPFVEDRERKLATPLDLSLPDSLISPAIFAVDPQRRVVWMQHGRSGVYYGDHELFDYLDCASVKSVSLPPATGSAVLLPVLASHRPVGAGATPLRTPRSPVRSRRD